jgi:hypothetical protein
MSLCFGVGQTSRGSMWIWGRGAERMDESGEHYAVVIFVLCAMCSLPNFVKVISSGRVGCTEQNFENFVRKLGKSPIISTCSKMLFQLTSRRRVGVIETERNSFLTSTPDGVVWWASRGWRSNPGEGQHDARGARLTGPLRPSELFVEEQIRCTYRNLKPELSSLLPSLHTDCDIPVNSRWATINARYWRLFASFLLMSVDAVCSCSGNTESRTASGPTVFDMLLCSRQNLWYVAALETVFGRFPNVLWQIILCLNSSDVCVEDFVKF